MDALYLMILTLFIVMIYGLIIGCTRLGEK